MTEKTYGLLGKTLSHSYSDQIHAMLGNPDYRLIELEPEQLDEFFAKEDIGGLNVTIPYKRAVMKYCRLSPAAADIGSVNTIISRGGKLFGFNTDENGFEYMAKSADIDFAGRRVAVLGSGGASLAVQYAVRKLGASDVKVISRTGVYNYSDISRWDDVEIVINATPVGMYPNEGVSPIDLRALPECRAVLDLIYNPLRTALVTQAQSLGIPCAGGLSMLVAQAKCAEELFFAKALDDSETERIIKRLQSRTENIVLIGMPGCGKSSIGELIGRASGREVLDTDAIIERDCGMTIPEIFEREGEEGFRCRELETVRSAGAQRGKIIVTGGGVVENTANYLPLHQNGIIFQIERPLELLETQGRPLSESQGAKKLFMRRRALYESFADESILNDKTVENAANSVYMRFLSHF